MARNVKHHERTVKMNISAMINNIFIAAINKGQLPLAIFGLAVIIIIIKSPVDIIFGTISDIIDGLINLTLLGWFLFLVSVLGSVLLFKRLRYFHSEEIKRISLEKNELQRILSEQKLSTSNKIKTK